MSSFYSKEYPVSNPSCLVLPSATSPHHHPSPPTPTKLVNFVWDLVHYTIFLAV